MVQMQVLNSIDMEGSMYESSPRLVLEGSSRSLESETASPWASTSDTEGNQDPGASTRWNGFFHMLKKGLNVRFQKWKSVPKLTRRKSKRIRVEMVPAHSGLLYMVNFATSNLAGRISHSQSSKLQPTTSAMVSSYFLQILIYILNVKINLFTVLMLIKRKNVFLLSF